MPALTHAALSGIHRAGPWRLRSGTVLVQALPRLSQAVTKAPPDSCPSSSSCLQEAALRNLPGAPSLHPLKSAPSLCRGVLVPILVRALAPAFHRCFSCLPLPVSGSCFPCSALGMTLCPLASFEGGAHAEQASFPPLLAADALETHRCHPGLSVCWPCSYVLQEGPVSSTKLLELWSEV